MSISFESEVLKQLADLTNHLERLEKKVDEHIPNFKKAGATFEILIRKFIKDWKGAEYARPFEIANLSGLARIVIPKNIDFLEQTFFYTAEKDSYLIYDNRIKKLAQKALLNIDKLKLILERFKVKTTKNEANFKYSLLDIALQQFDTLKNDADRLEYLKSSQLGFWAFSCNAFENGNYIFIHFLRLVYFCLLILKDSDFVYNLQLDVRGTSQVAGKRLEIRVGEIKSGKGRQAAIEQLVKRLCVMFQAAKVLLPETFDVTLTGEVFTIEDQWLRDQPNRGYLNSLMTVLGLKVLDNIEVVVLKVC